MSKRVTDESLGQWLSCPEGPQEISKIESALLEAVISPRQIAHAAPHGRPPNDAPEGMPSRLRQARLAAGFSITRAAELVGVSYSAWSKWEQGTCEPRFKDAM